RDGTTQVIFEPLDLLSRLAALVPKPRGQPDALPWCICPNHRLRAQIVPAKRERECPHQDSTEQGGGGSGAARMGWAQRLKRVFGIDVQHCEQCGGPMKSIASIENPEVIQKILQHLQEKGEYVSWGGQAVWALS
ncbi:MAG TPA: IS91 family transposase, partial [Steroidobacteraceae bacterium]